MALYTKYSSDWLEDSQSIKIVLVVLTIKVYTGGTWTDTPIYISNAAYITDNGVTVFNPIIKGDVTFSEGISDTGGISITYGDIGIANPNGEYDEYLDNSKYIWTNGSIEMYYGDPTWTCSNLADITSNKFLKIFDGTIGDIDSRNITTLNIKIRDKLQRLNTPLTTYKLGVSGYWAGGQLNVDTIRPVIFGEVFNVEPLLIDPSSLQYLFNHNYYVEVTNTGSVSSEKVIEVRDNGVPIYNDALQSGAYTVPANSVFTLLKQPAGTITASIQGIADSFNFTTGGVVSNAYSNNIASFIGIIVTKFGKKATRFTATDLDLANLYDFSTTCPQPIGAAIFDRQNVLEVCQSMVESVGAQLFVTRTGKLQILRYDGVGYTTGITISTISESDIIYNSLSISNKLPVVASVKVGYCKNWTVQTGLVSAIPQYHKDSFATEWLTITAVPTDNAVITKLANYKLDTDPVQKNTLLITTADATAEANRLLALYSTQKTIYKFTGGPRLLQLLLGQKITLTHSRFNLYNAGNGVTGQVVGLTPNWTKSSVDVEVLI
jgi:hypothetical protein